jgi:hypothetical protein
LSANVVANDGINHVDDQRKQKVEPGTNLNLQADIEFDPDRLSDTHVLAVALSAD